MSRGSRLPTSDYFADHTKAAGRRKCEARENGVLVHMLRCTNVKIFAHDPSAQTNMLLSSSSNKFIKRGLICMNESIGKMNMSSEILTFREVKK